MHYGPVMASVCPQCIISSPSRKAILVFLSRNALCAIRWWQMTKLLRKWYSIQCSLVEQLVNFLWPLILYYEDECRGRRWQASGWSESQTLGHSRDRLARFKDQECETWNEKAWNIKKVRTLMSIECTCCFKALLRRAFWKFFGVGFCVVDWVY